MNWVIASLLMFISSVVLYLGVRWSNQLKTPRELNNLSMFLVPVILYLIMDIDQFTSHPLPLNLYLFIIFQAFFFSYLGNLFSLKGIELSPNPGYSLIISKSYVVFTSIASIFLFASPLPLKSVIAILMIIGFSALIIIDKSKSKKQDGITWLPYTFGAFFCWGFLALSSKYLLDQGVPVLLRLSLSMGIVSLLILSEVYFKKISIKQLKSNQLKALLLVGVSGASFNYFMQVAFSSTPNVGYVNAVNAASISLLTLASAYIFKDELSLKKLIGIIGVTTGLLLLFV